MKSKVRYTAETIIVEPVDQVRLNIAVNQLFHNDSKIPANIEYRTRGIHAITRQPKLCIIDDEFVGSDIKDQITFYVFEEETQPDGRHTFSLMPSNEVTLSLGEMEQYLGPPITLAEFTKGRRGYNARIRANEADWIRYFNKP